MSDYNKPVISFQALNTATGVSDGCNMSSTSDPFACPVKIPGWGDETVFTPANCMWATNNPEEFDICYHGPTGIVSVFGS